MPVTYLVHFMILKVLCQLLVLLNKHTHIIWHLFQQSDVDEDSGDEDDGNSANDVFGITTVINLTNKQVP